MLIVVYNLLLYLKYEIMMITTKKLGNCDNATKKIKYLNEFLPQKKKIKISNDNI